MHNHNKNKKDGSMRWMMILHIAPMLLLIFWNKIPSNYIWVLYIGIGLFIASHFLSLFGSKGGCCGGHDHEKSSESEASKKGV